MIERNTGNRHNKYLDVFEWFDVELKAVFGIDVYDYPFDREKGYSIIEQDNVEVLVIKLEKINSLEQVIGDFVEVSDFKLINSNVSDKKPYKYLYKNMREEIRIPREVVDRYYKNSPRMKHFYTEEEINMFYKKWEKNIR
jgi:glutamate mutase epsilon subunit